MIMTLKEFTEKYRITRQTAYVWIDKGMPTEINFGNTIRLDEEKVIKWMKEQKERGE